jgi:hypothetical protein
VVLSLPGKARVVFVRPGDEHTIAEFFSDSNRAKTEQERELARAGMLRMLDVGYRAGELVAHQGRNRKPKKERLEGGKWLHEEKKKRSWEQLYRFVLKERRDLVPEFKGQPLSQKERKRVIERLRSMERDYRRAKLEVPKNPG